MSGIASEVCEAEHAYWLLPSIDTKGRQHIKRYVHASRESLLTLDMPTHSNYLIRSPSTLRLETSNKGKHLLEDIEAPTM